GSTLEIELRALFLDSHELLAAPALRLEVRGAAPAGALYFWSTTAQGVLRAQLDQTHSSYLAPAPFGSDASSCGGCHAVARDGRRLLLGRGSPAELTSYALPALERTLPAPNA